MFKNKTMNCFMTSLLLNSKKNQGTRLWRGQEISFGLKNTKLAIFSETNNIKNKKINAFDTNPLFCERINSRVHLDSTIIRFRTKSERIVLIPEFFVKVVDSIFTNCKTYDDGVGLNGGAIFADLFSDPHSCFIIHHVCFDKCSSHSSGGAVFMSANTIYQIAISYSNCQAMTGQCYSMFAYSSSTNLSKIGNCGYNNNRDYTYNKLQTLGGSYHLYEENNVTRNSISGIGAFMYLHYFNFANISYCVISKNNGQNGFHFADEQKNVLIEKSFVFGNVFTDTSIYTKSVVDISLCWYEVMKWNLTNLESSHLVVFMECIFNANKDEMKKFVNSETITDSKYDAVTLPVLSEINPVCFEAVEEKVVAEKKKKNDISPKVAILFTLAFISGACAVYAIMSHKNQMRGKKKVHAFESKYIARI
jgi:hypothetical protein